MPNTSLSNETRQAAPQARQEISTQLAGIFATAQPTQAQSAQMERLRQAQLIYARELEAVVRPGMAYYDWIVEHFAISVVMSQDAIRRTA